MKVKFENVGSQKKTWEAEIDGISHKALLRQIRDKNALMSRDVEFQLNDEGNGGAVIVGGWRSVGTFSVQGGMSLGRIELSHAKEMDIELEQPVERSAK